MGLECVCGRMLKALRSLNRQKHMASCSVQHYVVISNYADSTIFEPNKNGNWSFTQEINWYVLEPANKWIPRPTNIVLK